MLLERLNEASLDARKKAVKKEPGGENAAFLVWMLSEVNNRAKAEQRDPTDADVESILKQQLRALKLALEGNDDPDPLKHVDPLPEGEFRDVTQAKFDFIENFLPKPLVGEALAEAIRQAAVVADVVIGPGKAMGQIMTVLKTRYPGQIDGAQVKALIEHGV